MRTLFSMALSITRLNSFSTEPEGGATVQDMEMMCAPLSTAASMAWGVTRSATHSYPMQDALPSEYKRQFRLNVRDTYLNRAVCVNQCL